MKKILSFLLVLSMVLQFVPMPALAAEGDPCTVTEGCEGTYNAEGICTVCNLAQLVVTEGTEECQHSGGTATCTALANCDACGEPYGELAAHTGGEATCKAQAVCAVCTAAYGELAAHSYENGVCAGCGDVCAHAEYAEGKCVVCGSAEPDEPEECQHSGGIATCKEQAICEKCETAYGELAAHNYGTDADGKCDACGADCSHSYGEGVCGTCGVACIHESYSEGKCAVCNAACPHAEYAEGKCKVCGVDEPVQEPVALTITAWNWVDEYEILSEDGTYATLPNAADWETLKSVLPAYITAMVDGAEVEIPVQWECETFPTEGEGQGTYELKAILPDGYTLGEGVSALELEVDLGTVEQLAGTTTWDGTIADQAWESGSGIEENPYLIMTSQQLAKLAKDVNDGTNYAGSYFKLGVDLDMNGSSYSWTAIGTFNKTFKGTFDGNEKTISNLKIDDASQYTGFIGYLENGKVSDLTIADSYFKTSNAWAYLGAVVGYCKSGTIENCHNSGSTVISIDYYTAGIVGYCTTASQDAPTIISGCTNSGSITTGTRGGGIVGDCAGYTNITNCTNNGSVQLSENATTTAYVGGILGFNESSVASVEACTNNASVSGESWVGGIVGSNNGNIINCQNTTQASITGTESQIGGIVGANSGTVTECKNSAEVKGKFYVGGVAGSGVGLSGCINAGNVASNTYGAGGVVGYVYLSSGTGTIENCHNKGKVTGTYYIGGLVGNHYSGKVTFDGCSNKGCVEGSSHSVGGLLGWSSYSTVKNSFNTGDVTGIGKQSGSFCYGVGGLCGTTFQVSTFESCYNSGTVNGGSSSYIGGLLGYFELANGDASNYAIRCYNTGSVTGGSYVGGLFGYYKSKGVSENCYNTGSVSGSSYVGGLAGYVNYADCIKNSYNVGNVKGSSNFGGVIGNNNSLTNCYYLDTCVTSPKNKKGMPLTAEQMTDDTNWTTNYAGFDTSIWSKKTNNPPTGYLPRLDTIDDPQLTVAGLHAHNWEYTVSTTTTENDTITAKCSAENCNLTEGNGGSVTILKPNDLVYSNSSKDAALSYSADWALGDVTIQYNEVNRVNVTGQDITASVTMGEGEGVKTASVTYQVQPRTITADMVTLTPDSHVYDNAEKTVAVEVKYDSSTTLTTDDYSVTGITSATALSTGNGYAVTVEGKGNYKTESLITKYWTIKKAGITPTVSITGWTYGEGANEPEITGNNGLAPTYTYYTDAECTVKTGNDDGAASEGGVPVNAGTYYVMAEIAESEYYAAGSATAPFTIAKKEVTAILAADKTYNGSTAVEVTATVADADIVSSDSIVISGLTGTFADANAGENKTVTVDATKKSITGTGADNYDVVIPSSVTAKIAQKPLSEVTLTLEPNTFVYDSTEKEVTSITAKFGDVTLTEDTDYTVDDSSVTKATALSTGNGYAITINAVENGNYSGSQTAYWTITKAGNSWTTAPADSTWVYGSPAAPTANAQFGTVKVEYRLAEDQNGDAAYTETVPTNVGSYLVRFSVEGEDSYETLSEVKNLSITKASLTITADSKNITYGDAAPESYSVTGNGFKYNDNLDSLDATNASVTCNYKQFDDAATYDIIPSGYGSNNYTINYKNGALTVEQKEIGIQWSADPISFKENIPQAPTATATGLVTNAEGITDECTITVAGAQTDAGTYTATAQSLSNPNYKLPSDVTMEFTILNAAQAKPTGVAGVGETSMGQKDGKITGVDSTMEYRAEGETAYTAITGEEVIGLAAGKYYVRKAAKTNYNASEDVEITVSDGRMLKIYLPAEQTGYSLTASPAEVAYGGTVTLTYQLADGYTEGKTFAVTASKGTVTDNEDGTYTISNITEDTTVSVTGVSDVTVPTAEIAVTTNKWTEFLNTITFDLFFKQTQTVTITAADAGSDVDTIEYYLSDTAMTLKQVKEITTWSGYNGSFSIDAENQYVIYVKVTDNADNTLYINSNGIVLDKTVPVITGVTDDATYYTTQKVTATDSAISGTSTLQSLTGTNADGTIPGDPAQETKHTIVATDKAGNTTTFEITMKPISSLAAGLPTEETVKLTDKDAIEAIKKNVSDVLTNKSANATEEEKDKLEDIIAQCNDLLNQIKKAEDIIALIQALPDASKVEPDNKKHIDAYDAALAAYNDPNLPASSKRMVGEQNKAKLDAVGKALAAYDITHQSSKYYVKGSSKTLTFTANGYYADYGSYVANAYGKFVSIEVDGKVVNAKNYTAKAGSTIITLKTSYLESLSVGKHTIKVNYIDGSTDGEDTFRISVNNGNPFTGDDTHMMLFGGMALTSLLCMAMMIVFFPRKKGKYQR